jgi:hypothetical protein
LELLKQLRLALRQIRKLPLPALQLASESMQLLFLVTDALGEIVQERRGHGLEGLLERTDDGCAGLYGIIVRRRAFLSKAGTQVGETTEWTA